MTVLGTLIGGRYRLDAQIGRGGMSTVYRAFDIVLERPVAIKLMHREIAADSDQLERFRREARSVAQLNHPHVVTVIDAGEEPSTGDGHPGDGCPYIVLEYIEGETLKEMIRRERPTRHRAGDRLRDRDRARARRRTRASDRASRRQAAQHPDQRRRRREDHRLRHRAHAHRGRPDDGRDGCSAPPTTSLPSRRSGIRSPVSPTSTRSAWSCSRCSPATFPSTASRRSLSP